MNKLLYAVAGLITFLAFILIMAPASIAVSLAQDELKKLPDLKIGQVDGRIWSGSAEVQYRQFPAQVSWDLSPLPLIAGRVSADLEVEADGLDAAFHVFATNTRGEVTEGVATVDASYINQVSIGYGLELSGVFTLVADEVSFSDQWVTAVDGNLDWPGGIVHIETPQQLYSVNLPMLNGDLAMQGDNVHITIDGSENETRFVDLLLKPTGWTEVGISFAFMQLAGLPVPGDPDDGSEDPAVLLEEKIF